MGLESRGYWQEARYPGQSNDLAASLMFQPEFRWYSEDNRDRNRIFSS